MSELRPLVGELAHVIVQLIEHKGRDGMPVNRPTTPDGLSLMRTIAALRPGSALISVASHSRIRFTAPCSA